MILCSLHTQRLQGGVAARGQPQARRSGHAGGRLIHWRRLAPPRLLGGAAAAALPPGGGLGLVLGLVVLGPRPAPERQTPAARRRGLALPGLALGRRVLVAADLVGALDAHLLHDVADDEVPDNLHDVGVARDLVVVHALELEHRNRVHRRRRLRRAVQARERRLRHRGGHVQLLRRPLVQEGAALVGAPLPVRHRRVVPEPRVRPAQALIGDEPVAAVLQLRRPQELLLRARAPSADAHVPVLAGLLHRHLAHDGVVEVHVVAERVLALRGLVHAVGHDHVLHRRPLRRPVEEVHLRLDVVAVERAVLLRQRLVVVDGTHPAEDLPRRHVLGPERRLGAPLLHPYAHEVRVPGGALGFSRRANPRSAIHGGAAARGPDAVGVGVRPRRVVAPRRHGIDPMRHAKGELEVPRHAVRDGHAHGLAGQNALERAHRAEQRRREHHEGPHVLSDPRLGRARVARAEPLEEIHNAVIPHAVRKDDAGPPVQAHGRLDALLGAREEAIALLELPRAQAPVVGETINRVLVVPVGVRDVADEVLVHHRGLLGEEPGTEHAHGLEAVRRAHLAVLRVRLVVAELEAVEPAVLVEGQRLHDLLDIEPEVVHDVDVRADAFLPLPCYEAARRQAREEEHRRPRAAPVLFAEDLLSPLHLL
mmetsp:Transcript_46393/g.145145  ORF Transcript_46393/g.145145 Transcript_46393/m.145145 type:complete len:651 (+) Transcript_46393:191-2143(+)